MADVDGAPVWDELAEQSVVGAVMMSKDALEDASEIVLPADFYQPRHEVIFRAALAVAARNEPVDVVTVSDELQREGLMQRAGGLVYLHRCLEVTITPTNAAFYADIVRERAVRRRLLQAGQRIVGMGSSTEGDAAQALEAARAEIEAAASAVRSEVRPVGDSVHELIASLGSPPTFSPTPWASLDRLIGGFAPGGLYVVGARPGEGKTIVGLQAAAKLATLGPVAFISLEMSEADLQRRLIAQLGSVHMGKLREHRLSDEQMDAARYAAAQMKSLPLYVDEKSTTLAGIRSHVRGVARRGDLAGVVVDYLQLVEGRDPRQNRQEAVAEVSRGLKKLAMGLGVPIIALSQLNRTPEARADRTPRLSDLRESGAIEQDADVVLLLSHDRDNRPEELDIVAAKNRHGEQGRLALVWQGHYARLRDMGWDPNAGM